MPKITAIKKQATRERVSIFVDEKYSFSLSLNQFVDLGIKSGQDASESDIAKYKDTSIFGKQLDNAMAWALRRPHSEKELENYLYRKKVEQETSHKITDYLIGKGYIDNIKFTTFWIENRIRSKKPSKRALTAELRLKGIGNQEITTALEESGFSDEEMLKDLIEKKSRISKYKDDKKLKEYLVRQGFSYDLINSHLKK